MAHLSATSLVHAPSAQPQWRGHLPRVAAQLADRFHVLGLLGIGAQLEVLGYLPEEDLAVVGGRGDDRVVEGTPVRVQHNRGVSTKERDLVGQLASLFQGNHSERATTASFPVHGNVLGIGLDQIAVPGILRDAQVVIALFALDVLTEDVPCAL